MGGCLGRAILNRTAVQRHAILAVRCAALAAMATAFSGCAQNQAQRVASGGGIDPKYGVTASPRVVADGEEVPAGGGRYHVGKPYVIAGKTYYPSERTQPVVGTASWYGADFHGRRTANGEIFNRTSVSAASPTMPLPSYARVTNLRNSTSIIVRVNDRGPYHGGRVMDVSQKVAEALDFRHHGTTKVKVEYIGRAQLAGSDDTKLLASLRTDGNPATLDGAPIRQPTMVASREPLRATDVRTVSTTAALTNAEAEDDAAPIENASLRLASAPLPPSRPFDLGTIPGAGVPIGPGRNR